MATSEASYDAIFCEALEIESPEARQAYLDQACQGDEELRRKVQRLLDAHLRAGNFLAGPAVGATVDVAPIAERPGMMVGRYKLLQKIGEGGFGVVFMAEQQSPVTRKVALKVIKPGMDTNEVIARFEAERQALALMDNPHIAAIYDGGATDSGRPYFVMELVHGIPITDYCEQAELDPRERLALFRDVCQAVHHAHQKGVIHRDLKPSNILVTEHDGEPVVKVIDFGVAKATNQRLTEKTLFTRFGGMVGTPLYMSPEQADLSGLDVDIRTDIYALGVLLYELLTGTTPFEKDRMQKAAFDEIRRIIREEEPPRPSVRLSTLASKSRGPIGSRKQARPMRPNVGVDLDWIVMKALEKDRNRRYPTAAEFELDLQRHLDEKPIIARPPSMVYSLQKFTRRHRARIAFASVVAASLIIGGLWINERYGADTKSEFAQQIADFRTKLENYNSSGAGDTLKLEQAFDELCRSRLSRNPAVAATGLRLAAALAKSGQWEKSRAVIDRVRSNWTINAIKTLPITDTKELGRLLGQCAFDLSSDMEFPRGKLENAREIALCAHELGTNVNGTLAWIEGNLGNMEEARAALDRYLERHSEPSWTWFIEAKIAAATGTKELAQDWYRGACESMENIDHQQCKPLVASLTEWASKQAWDSAWPPGGWTQEDTRVLLEKLLNQRPRSSNVYRRLGSWHARQGRWTEARDAYQQAVALAPKGARDSTNVYDRLSLGGALLQVGDTAAYRRLCQETMQPEVTRDFSQWRARDVALLCCVVENSGVSASEVRTMCEEALVRSQASWSSIGWVKGMLEYRSGKWDKAVNMLRGQGGGGQLGIVAPYFCAMAYHKSGDQKEALERLALADRHVANKVPSPDAKPTEWYETPMIWSLVQPVRREAHALIDGTSVADTDEGTDNPKAK